MQPEAENDISAQAESAGVWVGVALGTALVLVAAALGAVCLVRRRRGAPPQWTSHKSKGGTPRQADKTAPPVAPSTAVHTFFDISLDEPSGGKRGKSKRSNRGSSARSSLDERSGGSRGSLMACDI